MASEALLLEVVTPEREVVRDSVSEIQLPGSNGALGILPGHTPLLTELGIGALSYKIGGETRYIAIVGGFAEVLSDRVTVLAESAERADEINLEAASAAFALAAAAVGTGPATPEIDWTVLQRNLEVASARLEVAGHGGAVTQRNQH
jgi:F-type H+-transporting ATPase subunit epsilon